MAKLDEQAARAYFAEHFFDIKTDGPMVARTLEIQAVVYSILKEFLRVCKALEIKAYPIFGTLLGTIRHQGFIPWDDDIDMALFREDYEVFKEKGHHFLSEDYEILDLSKDQATYRGSYLRLMYKASTAIDVKQSWNEEIITGIWMDVMPMDCMHEDEAANRDKIRQIRATQQRLRCKLYPYDEERFKISKETYDRMAKEAEAYSVADLQQRVTTLALEGSKASDNMGICVMNGQEATYEAFSREDFSATVKGKFKDIELEIPRGYDRLLKYRYGLGYQKFPPLNQRMPHHQCFYAFDVPYAEYRRRFFDFFNDIEDKKIIVFGAGHVSLNYLNRFGKTHAPAFILDNDVGKWGKKLSEIPFTDMPIEEAFATDRHVLDTDLGSLEVKTPEILQTLDMTHHRLIICSAYFREIGNQLKAMGLEDYHIFVQKKEWLLVM